MNAIDPADIFSGTLLILAPHMDDEVLACGGTMAGLPRKDRVHVVYATDGTRSPVPAASTPDASAPELESIRMQEARAAMAILGIPESNLYFLGLPDGALQQQEKELTPALVETMHGTRPDQILAPFRYDRHPDHLALYRATLQAVAAACPWAELYEYFVYHRYRLLPGGDIRRFIRPHLRMSVNIQLWSAKKKQALQSYRSQTTLFYSWQARPILPQKRVDDVSRQPEIFLKYDPGFPGPDVFGHGQAWIRLMHLVEPLLKHRKDQMLGMLKRGLAGNGR